MSVSAKSAAPLFEGSPVCGFMATFALRAESTSMFIVFLVARHTGRRNDHAIVHRCGVAVITPQPFMCAVQFKFGACVVIEVPNLPIPRIMAVFATAAQLPAMNVVAFVTGMAFDRCCVCIKGPFMAAVTHHRAMLAE